MAELDILGADHLAGQEEINKWFDSLLKLAAECLTELESKIREVETYDLLSNISFYNHLHNADEYTDFRGDKMFVVSEVIALIALKKQYIAQSTADIVKGTTLIKEVQDLANKYYGLITFQQMKEHGPRNDHSVEGIAFKTMRDETAIRNPALPEHHLEFSAKLYEPVDGAIKQKFGFSVKESILLREGIFDLIPKKINDAKAAAEEQSLRMAMEVYKYRATKVVPENASLSEESLVELNKLSRKQIKESCFHYCWNELFYHLGQVYCFTASELASHVNLEQSAVDSFLNLFSCTFPSLDPEEKLVGPSSILKTKPLLEHEGRYLLPSFPLLNWAVEPVIENYIKSQPKLQDKFKESKHHFLLQTSVESFSRILKGQGKIYQNLFYYEAGNKDSLCETDGIIAYERTLFIIEAKGNRFSQPAKEGKIVRTEKHLEQIVKDSYGQGLRTLNYIKDNPKAGFFTAGNQKIQIDRSDFDEYVLISLALEPIGSVTPLIRATNELGYFRDNIFPWIISVYDLVVVADHLEMPILLLHYIKRRKEFLERKIMHVFEEIDLLSYYLHSRLYIERMFREAEEKQVNMVYMNNETDAINNFYMHKYRLKNPDPPKLKLKVPPQISAILRALETTKFNYRQEIMLRLLDLPPHSMEQLSDYIARIKRIYRKDGKKHDCSIMTHIWGQKTGFTFMAGPDKIELDKSLYFYCQYKLEEQKADVWVGVGDVERSEDSSEIHSAIIILNNNSH